MIRKLLNPEASATNTLKVLKSQAGCCNGEMTECKYTITDSSAITFRGLKITEDGVTSEFNISDAPDGTAIIAAYGGLSTDAEKIKYLQTTMIPTVLGLAGYVVGSKSDIQISSDLKTFIFIGEAVITAIVDDNPADIAVDETACTKTTICDYSANTEGGEDPVISIAGVDYAVDGTATYGVTSPAAFQVLIETAVGSNALAVSVEDDSANSSYKVTITTYTGVVVVIDGNATQCCDVRGDYKV